MSSFDYPILSAPRISLSAFAHVLSGSPMAGEASAIYSAFAAKGVDPTIGLAIAAKESSYGKLGIAVGRNNPFGDRYYPSAAAFGAVDSKGWASFPSYAAAARYEASLLAGPGYAGGSSYTTARTFAARYAPASDGNDPTGYGAQIVAMITGWTGGSGAIAAAPAASWTPSASLIAQATAASPAGSTAGPAAPTMSPTRVAVQPAAKTTIYAGAAILLVALVI